MSSSAPAAVRTASRRRLAQERDRHRPLLIPDDELQMIRIDHLEQELFVGLLSERHLRLAVGGGVFRGR